MIDYNVKIIADSVNPVGDRLTTFELTYPRFVHAELMTHRLFSRNSASSRAIPTSKLRERIAKHPVLPKWWGKNQRGMQAREELKGAQRENAELVWLAARDKMLEAHAILQELGVHKQITNRILEPWMFITVLVSATEFENWFALRNTWPEGQPPGPAQPEIAWVAREMRRARDTSTPNPCSAGAWHLPLVELFDAKSPLYVPPTVADEETLIKISVARCARVSYLTHDGERDFQKDVELHDKLSQNGHWSPFEHVAQACGHSTRSGNFIGWKQYRKSFATEHAGRQLPCT